MQIRNIEMQDLAAVVALIRELAEYESLSQYCEVTEERLAAALFGEGSFLEGFIALDGAAAVGYALYFPYFSSFRGQRSFYIDDIYVTSSHRGRGLGIELIRRIARVAAERGFERIDFLVAEKNAAAIDFYKKHGAETNADERHFKFVDAAFRKLAS